MRPLKAMTPVLRGVLCTLGYEPSILYMRYPAVQDRAYPLIPIRKTTVRIHACTPLGAGSYGASVLNQNGQRNHCYLFVGTSKNSLASQSFSFSLRTFSALPLSR